MRPTLDKVKEIGMKHKFNIHPEFEKFLQKTKYKDIDHTLYSRDILQCDLQTFRLFGDWYKPLARFVLSNLHERVRLKISELENLQNKFNETDDFAFKWINENKREKVFILLMCEAPCEYYSMFGLKSEPLIILIRDLWNQVENCNLPKFKKRFKQMIWGWINHTYFSQGLFLEYSLCFPLENTSDHQ